MAAKKIVKHTDPGLALIARYERAIVQNFLDRAQTGGYTADEIKRERVAVEALAARIGDAMRTEYRARNPKP